MEDLTGKNTGLSDPLLGAVEMTGAVLRQPKQRRRKKLSEKDALILALTENFASPGMPLEEKKQALVDGLAVIEKRFYQYQIKNLTRLLVKVDGQPDTDGLTVFLAATQEIIALEHGKFKHEKIVEALQEEILARLKAGKVFENKTAVVKLFSNILINYDSLRAYKQRRLAAVVDMLIERSHVRFVEPNANIPEILKTIEQLPPVLIKRILGNNNLYTQLTAEQVSAFPKVSLAVDELHTPDFQVILNKRQARTFRVQLTAANSHETTVRLIRQLVARYHAARPPRNYFENRLEECLKHLMWVAQANPHHGLGLEPELLKECLTIINHYTMSGNIKKLLMTLGPQVEIPGTGTEPQQFERFPLHFYIQRDLPGAFAGHEKIRKLLVVSQNSLPHSVTQLHNFVSSGVVEFDVQNYFNRYLLVANTATAQVLLTNYPDDIDINAVVNDDGDTLLMRAIKSCVDHRDNNLFAGSLGVVDFLLMCRGLNVTQADRDAVAASNIPILQARFVVAPAPAVPVLPLPPMSDAEDEEDKHKKGKEEAGTAAKPAAVVAAASPAAVPSTVSQPRVNFDDIFLGDTGSVDRLSFPPAPAVAPKPERLDRAALLQKMKDRKKANESAAAVAAVPSAVAEPKSDFEKLCGILHDQDYDVDVNDLVLGLRDNIKKLSIPFKQALGARNLRTETQALLINCGFGAYLMGGVLFHKLSVGHLDILVKAGVSVNEQDDAGNTPLFWAVNFGYADAVQWLLNNGAVINERVKQIAREKNNPAINIIFEEHARKVVIARPVAVVAAVPSTVAQEHANQEAVAQRERVKQALAARKERQERAAEQEPAVAPQPLTPEERKARVQELKGKLDARKKAKETAVVVEEVPASVSAPEKSDFENLCEILNDPDMDVDINDLVQRVGEKVKELSNEQKQMLCFFDLSKETQALLVQQGLAAYLMIVPICNKTPIEALDSFIKRFRVNVNLPDDNGVNPLHWAAQQGNLEAVECLVAHGADITVKRRNGKGSTPCDIAKSKVKHLMADGKQDEAKTYTAIVEFLDQKAKELAAAQKRVAERHFSQDLREYLEHPHAGTVEKAVQKLGARINDDEIDNALRMKLVTFVMADPTANADTITLLRAHGGKVGEVLDAHRVAVEEVVQQPAVLREVAAVAAEEPQALSLSSSSGPVSGRNLLGKRTQTLIQRLCEAVDMPSEDIVNAEDLEIKWHEKFVDDVAALKQAFTNFLAFVKTKKGQNLLKDARAAGDAAMLKFFKDYGDTDALSARAEQTVSVSAMVAIKKRPSADDVTRGTPAVVEPVVLEANKVAQVNFTNK